MRRLSHCLLVGLFVATMTPGCAVATGGAVRVGTGTLQRGASASHRYLVHFRDGLAPANQDLKLRRSGAQTIRDIPQIGVRLVRMTEPGTLRDADVEYVEVDAVRQVPERPSKRGIKTRRHPSQIKLNRQVQAGSGRSVNDPLRPEQWGLDAIGIESAWERTLGSPQTVVAVVDTGVDVGHPDLIGRVVPGMSFVNEAPNDDGLVEGPRPAFRNVGPIDDNGHGTHVAGIIAAEADNNVGIAGVAPRCRIMPVKVLAYNTRGYDGDVAAGIVWAVDHGARIINMSLGGEGGGRTLERAVRYAQTHGVLVVAAMGNDRENPEKNNGTNLNYPASYEGVLAVAATDPDGGVASYSNYGRWVSVAAPGSGILSTTPTYETFGPTVPDYDREDGTSMAAPFVSGLGALLLSARPHLSGRDVKRYIEDSARDLLLPGFDFQTGSGLVDARKLLAI